MCVDAWIKNQSTNILIKKSFQEIHFVGYCSSLCNSPVMKQDYNLVDKCLSCGPKKLIITILFNVKKSGSVKIIERKSNFLMFS